jgi:hypothetical protein
LVGARLELVGIPDFIQINFTIAENAWGNVVVVTVMEFVVHKMAVRAAAAWQCYPKILMVEWLLLVKEEMEDGQVYYPSSCIIVVKK